MIYNFKLQKNEIIKFIYDDTDITINDNTLKLTIIITNYRILILDYPSIINPQEDLRISKGINYIRKKEIIFSYTLEEITKIEKIKKGCKIEFKDNNHVIIKIPNIANKILQIL